VAICHVDDPKNFGGFRVEVDGLYVVMPDAEAILTPQERAAVTWHPTGQHDKPAHPLPCALGLLRGFVTNAGLLGCIDEGEVAAVLRAAAAHVTDDGKTGGAAQAESTANVRPQTITTHLLKAPTVDRAPRKQGGDRLTVAMIKGYDFLTSAHGLPPKCRSLFDWLKVNDDTGAIEDSQDDVLTFLRGDGGLKDVTFEAFKDRFTRLPQRKKPR
jgi:hypothetical protein